MNRSTIFIASLVVFASASPIGARSGANAIGPAYDSSISKMLGVTAWASSYKPGTSSLLQGAEDVARLGVKNIMLCMGPNYQTQDYPGTSFPTVRSLTELAQTQPFQQVLGMPFQTIAIDASGLNDGKYFLSQMNYDQVYKEMYEFVKYLLKAYKGSGKTFILKNWEGDYYFDIDQQNPNHPPVSKEIENMRLWFKARHDAIAAARAELQGETDVVVKDAVEFVNLDCARTGTHPCVLTDVLPYVESDMVSYSAYQTINPGALLGQLESTISANLAFIRNLPGMNRRPLMIGEFGFSSDVFGADKAAELTQTAVTAFSQEDIPYAFLWQIRDTGGIDKGMGLLAPDGTETKTYGTVARMVGTPTRSPAAASFLSKGAARPNHPSRGSLAVTGRRGPTFYRPILRNDSKATGLRSFDSQRDILEDSVTTSHDGSVIQIN